MATATNNCHKRQSSTLPRIWNVHVSSSSSILDTPSMRRAALMLEPWLPIARPTRSWRTVNWVWCWWSDVLDCSRVSYTNHNNCSCTNIIVVINHEFQAAGSHLRNSMPHDYTSAPMFAVFWKLPLIKTVPLCYSFRFPVSSSLFNMHSAVVILRDIDIKHINTGLYLLCHTAKKNNLFSR